MTGDFSALRILQVPSCEMVDFSPSELVDPLPIREREGHTLQECTGKINTNVPIPSTPSNLFDLPGDCISLDLLYAMNDALLITKPDDNLGNTEQERLSPKLEQLALVFHQVAVVPDFRGCF